MSAVEATSAQLDALVSGKRSGVRVPVSLSVCIKGVHREFEGVARDLSLQGALILLEKEQLAAGEEGPLDASTQFLLLDRHLGQNFDIQFRAARIVVEARLTRFTLTTDADAYLGLGCQFVHSLGDQQARALGLRGEQDVLTSDWDTSLGLFDIQREADPARPLSALLLDSHEAVRGPVFLGAVARAGRRAIVVRLDGIPAEQVEASLSGCDLRVCLTRGTKRLLDVPADCVAMNYVDGLRPGAEVLLALPQRLPRAAWRLLRRRSD